MSIFAGRLSRRNFDLAILFIFLLVPIVLGILSSIVLVALGDARQQAADAKARADANFQMMQQALQENQQTPQQ